MSIEARVIYCFDRFFIDPGSFKILHNNREVSLRRKSFEILVYLLENRNRVVSKSELFKSIWQDTFVNETAASQCISEIRKVLCDESKAPKFVKTIARVGYQFVADVRELPILTNQPSIAILAFKDMSREGDLDYLCEGLAEEIINTLSQFKVLRVAGRTSAFSFKEKNIDLREIGNRLGVESVLEGSLRRSDIGLRVGAQLITVSDGFHLWSEQFDVEMSSIFAIRDQISKRIIECLNIEARFKEKHTYVETKTVNLDAYLLYLRARHLFIRDCESSVKKAIKYFEEAIERDNNFSDAYAELSLCYSRLGFANNMPPTHAYQRAKQFATKAIELDPSSSLAHATMGFVALLRDWDWEKADEATRRAITLNPLSEDACVFRAIYHVAVGNAEQAVIDAQKAVRLEPLSNLSNSFLAWCLLRSGKLSEAIDQLEKTLELEPADPRNQLYLGQSYLLSSRTSEGLETIQKALDESGGNLLTLSGLGWAYGMAGRRAEALEIICKLKNRFDAEEARPYLIAKVYAGLGEKDLAFHWLNLAFQQHDSSLTFVKTDETLPTIQNDPRFDKLLQRMNLATR
jgi:TolB-like protein/Tfp pilus assembly protein PilF